MKKLMTSEEIEADLIRIFREDLAKQNIPMPEPLGPVLAALFHTIAMAYYDFQQLLIGEAP